MDKSFGDQVNKRIKYRRKKNLYFLISYDENGEDHVRDEVNLCQSFSIIYKIVPILIMELLDFIAFETS